MAEDHTEGALFCGDAYWFDWTDSVYSRMMGHVAVGIRLGKPFWFKTIPDPYEIWLLQQAGWKGKALVLTRDDYTAEPEDLQSPDG